MRVFPFICVTLLFTGLLSVGPIGCEAPVEQRCSDIDQLLRARGDGLPTRCERDSDCQVVEVRPGLPSVTNQSLEGGEIVALQATYLDECGEFDTRYSSATAFCEVDDENQGALRFCSMDVRWSYTAADTGSDLETDLDDEPVCQCATPNGADPNCPNLTPICDGCLCVDRCLSVCLVIDSCDQLESLGFGLSTTDCATRCRTSLQEDPGAADVLACLESSTCGEFESCD